MNAGASESETALPGNLRRIVLVFEDLVDIIGIIIQGRGPCRELLLRLKPGGLHSGSGEKSGSGVTGRAGCGIAATGSAAIC